MALLKLMDFNKMQNQLSKFKLNIMNQTNTQLPNAMPNIQNNTKLKNVISQPTTSFQFTQPLVSNTPNNLLAQENLKNWKQRSEFYKGKKFNGYYEGNENPDFVISVGHSRIDSGAEIKGENIGEYWINYDIAKKTAAELIAQGYKVGILERKQGKSIDLNFVNENFKGTKLVELHNNAGAPNEKTGVFALKSTQNNDNTFGQIMTKNISEKTGLHLNQDIGNEAGLKNPIQGRGSAFANRLTNIDNCLLEIGALTSPEEVQKIKANNGYNVVLGLTNGFLATKGKKIEQLTTMELTNQNTNVIAFKNNILAKERNLLQVVSKNTAKINNNTISKNIVATKNIKNSKKNVRNI